MTVHRSDVFGRVGGEGQRPPIRVALALDLQYRGLGVAVILRYTLRLLTLDQLARAATLK